MITPMEISWRKFKGLKQLNEFISSKDHLDKAGYIQIINGKPDHIINVQIMPDNSYVVYYWTRKNDWKKPVDAKNEL